MKVKVTNRLDLPQAIVHAVANDPYDGGKSDFTATGLLKPARMAQLSKNAELTEDAADRLYSLQGQIMHHILERAGKDLRAEGFIVERRYYKEYVVDGKTYTISAQIDIYDGKEGMLHDYKYTSVGAAKRGLKADHYHQLNLQAELLRTGYYIANGLTVEGIKGPWGKITPNHQVNGANVILLLRDWSAEKVYEGYPPSPTVKQVVGLMSSDEVTEWVVSRIRAHVAAALTLPECTDEERWSRPTFAVMKGLSAARATRVFDTRSEAEAFIATKGEGFVIVERPGISVRCLRYCPARFVCEQAKQYRQAAPAQADEEGMVKV